jgi:phosphomannomutase
VLPSKETERAFGERRMRHFLFDVDGTLTEARKSMDSKFISFFSNWMRDKSVFLVSGSDLPKLNEQVPTSISSKCKGVFTCMGNEFWESGKLSYRIKWVPPDKLIEDLERIRKCSPYRIKQDNYIEIRTGMLNFSIAGRGSTGEERMLYNNWDNESKEREQTASFVNTFYPDLEACLGGAISVDIQPKGNNKSLASKWIRKNIGGEMVFFGDKIFKCGNDWEIAEDIKENKDGKCHQVENFLETKSILTTIYSKNEDEQKDPKGASLVQASFFEGSRNR